MKIRIQGGRVIDPVSGLDQVTDVFIDNQLIAAIGEAPDGFAVEQSIDASGQLVLPGLVDIQCRLREPGQTRKATIASETRAARAGGVTSLCIPPDTLPVIDNSAVIELIHHSNLKAGNLCHLYPIGALTKSLQGEQLSNMAMLRETGCVALSNAFAGFCNTLVQRRAMEYAAGLGMLVVIQPRDLSLYANGCAHEGELATRLGLPPVPEAAETAALAKDIELVAQTGARTHFGQLSCARSVEMIRQAKRDGLPVSCDVAMHQLFLVDRDIEDFDSNKLTLPPLRSMRDRDALREGVADGSIDCICSDHQPQDQDSKLAPFPSASPGISALETLLPLGFRLIEEGVLDLPQLVDRLSSAPARIFGLPAGRLAAGEIADVLLVETGGMTVCDPAGFLSAGKNSPFAGWDFSARVSLSLLAGKPSA
jgi:dihydroorotase